MLSLREKCEEKKKEREFKLRALKIAWSKLKTYDLWILISVKLHNRIFLKINFLVTYLSKF